MFEVPKRKMDAIEGLTASEHFPRLLDLSIQVLPVRTQIDAGPCGFLGDHFDARCFLTYRFVYQMKATLDVGQSPSHLLEAEEDFPCHFLPLMSPIHALRTLERRENYRVGMHHL